MAEMNPGSLSMAPASQVFGREYVPSVVDEDGVKKLEEEVNCPLCLGELEDPRILSSCHHVYCKACLEGLLRAQGTRGKVACPECRRDTPVPANDVSLLPVAFHINRLKEIYHQMVNAPMPSYLGFSGHAGGPLGTPPTQRARTPPAPSQHEASYNAVNNRQCRDHPGHVLEIYCKQDYQLVCNECVLFGRHKDHNYAKLGDVCDDQRQRLQQSLEPLKGHRDQVERSLNGVRTVQSEINSQKMAMSKTVGKSFEMLMESFYQQREALLNLIDQTARHKTDALSRQEQEMYRTYTQLNQVIEGAQQSMRRDSNFEFLSKSADMTRKVEEAGTMFSTLDLQPLASSDTRVAVPDQRRLQEWCSHECYLYLAADPSKTMIEGAGILRADTLKPSRFNVNVYDAHNQPSNGEQKVTVEVKSMKTKLAIDATVDMKNPSKYIVTYIPESRGRHEVTVKVDNVAVPGSPFVVMVAKPADMVWSPLDAITTGSLVGGLSYKNGQLYLSETLTGQIVVLDMNYQTVLTIGNGRLAKPCEVAVDKEMNIYFSTQQDHQVHKFTKDGRHVKTIGGPGTRPGEFNFPNGAFMSPDEKLYVCDSNNKRVQVFDTDLNLVRIITNRALRWPADVQLDQHGNIYITDKDAKCVHVLSPEGRPLRLIGRQRIKAPLGLSITNKEVYITDYIGSVVQVFTLDGDFICQFGGPGTMMMPAGIAIDDDGFVYVANQSSVMPNAKQEIKIF